MSARDPQFPHVELIESTRTHVRWTLQQYSAPVSFPCHQCQRAVTDSVVAIKTTSSGRRLPHCTDCHRRKVTTTLDARDQHSVFDATAPELDGKESKAAEDPEPEIVIQQADPGRPHDVVQTESGLRWTFVLRQHHLDHGYCPLPAQAVRRMRTVKVVHLDYGRAFPTVLSATLGKKITGNRLRGMGWPQTQVMPGLRITADLGRTRLRLSLTPLERPVHVARRKFLHDYDPRVIARELPAITQPDRKGVTSSLELLVQETIRKLGYLDEEGRALLPMPNLVSNVRSHRGSQDWSGEAVRAAVDGLIRRQRLRWATGSCAADGILNYPARPGERTVRLVCYTPFVVPVRKQEQLRVVHLPSAASRHGVAGHLMKIGHLGKQPSDEARAAYSEAHRKAGLTGSHKLPKGHTYVRPHKRGAS
ncbi:hypothetical protein ACOZE4_21375 [Streptomyces griseoincarnatus]